MAFKPEGTGKLKMTLTFPDTVKDDKSGEVVDVANLLTEGILRRLPPQDREKLSADELLRAKEARKHAANTVLLTAIEGKRTEEQERLQALANGIAEATKVDDEVEPV